MELVVSAIVLIVVILWFASARPRTTSAAGSAGTWGLAWLIIIALLAIFFALLA